MRKIPMILSIALTSACSQPPNWEGSLEALLTSQPDRFGTVMQNPEKYRVQIMYTQINRDAANKPSFSTYTYHVDPSMYFYPASTVKLPTAALALEKINRLKLLGIDRDTTMLTDSDADYQTPVIADPSSATGLPSVAHYIRKILLVSDNDAFNRLYEFIGQKEINQSLQQKGYLDTRIVHRLETVLSKSQNQWTNPIRFVNADEIVHTQEAKRNQINFYGSRQELLGVAEMVNGERLQRPKDFAEKNAYSLMDQHSVIKNLMFPLAVPEKKRFNLNEDDYRFMYRYMSMYPGESAIEDYSDKAKYPPGYVKFLMFGGDAKSIPDHIRVFNKVGDAYGFLTDSAYIVDFKNKVEFLLSATIYTNENQTFNDNEYEYDEIALPFLKNLGQIIYDVELNRPREFKADLSRFQFTERDQ
jgi:hypothetical protein